MILQNVHHAYAQTDGTYKWPNSREGDMLRQAKCEIEVLTGAATEVKAVLLVGSDKTGMGWHEKYEVMAKPYLAQDGILVVHVS